MYYSTSTRAPERSVWKTYSFHETFSLGDLGVASWCFFFSFPSLTAQLELCSYHLGKSHC